MKNCESGMPTGPVAAMLIRPDGYAAWAAGVADLARGLPEALRTWFGAPG